MNFSKAEFIRSAASAKDFPRDGLPRVLFAGRSNVGKSSTINTLLQRKNFARVSASPGKTVFVNLFRIDERVWFVDLPGYGYARVSQREKERFSRLPLALLYLAAVAAATLVQVWMSKPI